MNLLVKNKIFNMYHISKFIYKTKIPIINLIII